MAKPHITARIDVEHLGHVEYDMVGPTARFGEHVVPKTLNVVFPSDSDSPRLEMMLEVEDGAATCRELRLVAKEGRRGVAAGDLRAVRLSEWIEDLFTVAAMRASREETSPGVYKITYRSPDERVAAEALRAARRKGARRTITDARLAEVAKVYLEADRAPTRAVADHFNKSPRTATDYVARARAAGHLPKEG